MKKFILILLLILVLAGCNNKSTIQEEEFGYARRVFVTAYPVDHMINHIQPLVMNAFLQNNSQPELFYRGGRWNRYAQLFREVEYGVYTLTIDSENYQQYIDNNFKVNAELVDHPYIILVPEGFDGIRYSIINETGQDVKSVFVRIPVIWEEISLKEIIPAGGIYSLLMERDFLLPQMDVRLIDINNNVYTKYEGSSELNNIFLFTEEDLDGEGIEHITDLSDSHRFDIFMQINFREVYEGNSWINLRTYVDFPGISLKMNDETISFNPFTFVNDFYSSSTVFNAVHGETYKIEINTINPNMSEIAYLKLIQDMFVDFPQTLESGDNVINWMFSPDNGLDSDFLLLSVESRNHAQTWKQIEHLSPALRHYVIPAGTNPLLLNDGVIFEIDDSNLQPRNSIILELFAYTYSVSGRMSFRSSQIYSVRYVNDD
ncbi:MAG: lipoprotein [Candidatus Cloacimonetes bacterium]|nr:lipoprotein [Candidatus Cloacimonadota bacterium]